MNFIRRLFFVKDNKKAKLEWNNHLEKISKSIKNNQLHYPIILFCDVLWDFQIFKKPAELIGTSILQHWGLNEHLSFSVDETELIIDSSGKCYKLSHTLYDKITKTRFSYPSNLIGNETLENLKKRIINGCKEYIDCCITLLEEKETLEEKIKVVNKIKSISELIFFVDKELNNFQYNKKSLD